MLWIEGGKFAGDILPEPQVSMVPSESLWLVRQELESCGDSCLVIETLDASVPSSMKWDGPMPTFQGCN